MAVKEGALLSDKSVMALRYRDTDTERTLQNYEDLLAENGGMKWIGKDDWTEVDNG